MMLQTIAPQQKRPNVGRELPEQAVAGAPVDVLDRRVAVLLALDVVVQHAARAHHVARDALGGGVHAAQLSPLADDHRVHHNAAEQLYEHYAAAHRARLEISAH